MSHVPFGPKVLDNLSQSHPYGLQKTWRFLQCLNLQFCSSAMHADDTTFQAALEMLDFDATSFKVNSRILCTV